MHMRAAAVMLGAALGGCMGAGDGPGPTGARTSDPVAAGREVSRAIWGVVPSAPRRKADLRPELIRGAAVAVAADTLLADCRATEGRTSVGLGRQHLGIAGLEQHIVEGQGFDRRWARVVDHRFPRRDSGFGVPIAP